MTMNQKHISYLIRKLRQRGDLIFLESQMHEHPESKKSYLAAQPKAWIKAYEDEIQIWENNRLRTEQGNAWEALKEFRETHNDWLFGYLGYDLKNQVEDLNSQNQRLTNAPDLFFMVPDTIAEISLKGELNVVKGTLPTIKSENQQQEFELELQTKIAKEQYIGIVEQAKNDIYEGAYYEINLSHPLQFSFNGDGLSLYEAMREAGPVPFAGYANIQEVELSCASPERFLARRGNTVWSQPIKGTASREKENSSQELQKLLASEKEKAENLMIVDLVRNDLSRVAQKNSVTVADLFQIQSFETVHQMVSTVQCKLDENIDSFDVIKSCFPMGSMTGAPKIASMKAIEKYENYRRGIYSGALGYIKPNGDFDFNVIIRTAIIQDEKLIYPVGGAITSDSDSEAEWKETLVKARALTNIFQKGEMPE